MGGNRVTNNMWVDNGPVDVLGFSVDPRRVTEKMYNFVSSRGSCVATSGPVPKQVCSTNSECDDGNLCNGIETCDTVSGNCVSGTPHVCPSDGNACNGPEFCNFVTNQCESSNQSPCSDGNTCNGLETCTAGADDNYFCSPGEPTCEEIVHATPNQYYW